MPNPQFQNYYQILNKTLQKDLLGPVIEEVTHTPQKIWTSIQWVLKVNKSYAASGLKWTITSANKNLFKNSCTNAAVPTSCNAVSACASRQNFTQQFLLWMQWKEFFNLSLIFGKRSNLGQPIDSLARCLDMLQKIMGRSSLACKYFVTFQAVHAFKFWSLTSQVAPNFKAVTCVRQLTITKLRINSAGNTITHKLFHET